jgi:uncharacterized protein YjbI with pentapeptide repeats
MISFSDGGKALPIFHIFGEEDNPESMRGRLFEKCYFRPEWIKDKDIEGSIFYNCKFDKDVEEPSGSSNIIIKNVEYLKKADNTTTAINDFIMKHYPQLPEEYFVFGIIESNIYFENFEAFQWYFTISLTDSILKNVKFLTDEFGGWGHSEVEYEMYFSRVHLDSCEFFYLDDAKKLSEARSSFSLGILFQQCEFEKSTLAGSTDVSGEISPLNTRNRVYRMVLWQTIFKSCTFKNIDFRLYTTIEENTFDNCVFEDCIIQVQKMMKIGGNNFINCDIINCKNQLDIPLYVGKGKGTYSS